MPTIEKILFEPLDEKQLLLPGNALGGNRKRKWGFQNPRHLIVRRRINAMRQRLSTQEDQIMVLSRADIMRLARNGYDVRVIRKIDSGIRSPRPRHAMRHFHADRKQEMKEMYIAVVSIARRMERLIETAPEDSGGSDKKPDGLFRDFVDEEKLGKCFWKIYTKFFGIEPTAHLEGNDTDKVTFAAYLFSLVEHEHLGSDSFSSKGKQPFFEYIKKHIPDIEATPRTFHNRLTKTLGTFRKRLAVEERDSDFRNDYWNRNIYLRNFLEVRRNFRNDDYYKELEPLL